MKFNSMEDALKYVQLEIMVEIDRICTKHNIRYYLAYGTLIGAIRHNGFIPWDDDIDIMMPYDDMKKFAEVCKEELDERFFYQSPETDAEYGVTINRVRRNNSLLIEPTLANKNVHQGIMVDIYPLFGAETSCIKRKIQVINAMRRALYMLNDPVQNHGSIMKYGSLFLLKTKTAKMKKRIVQRITDKFEKCSFDGSDYVTVLDSGVKEMSTTYKRSWFGDGVRHKFEQYEFIVPDNSDMVLKTYFGDYMVLPPEEQRVFHHKYLKIQMPDGIEY